jgi:transcriptional accessory protein Tex/SPT6
VLTFDQWLDLLKVAFVAAASLLAFGRFMQRVDKPQTEQKGAQDHIDSVTLIVAIEKRVDTLEDRMDGADAKMSEWMSKWQGFESRMRDIFPDKGVCASQMHESENDRRQLRSELTRVWDAIGKRD